MTEHGTHRPRLHVEVRGYVASDGEQRVERPAFVMCLPLSPLRPHLEHEPALRMLARGLDEAPDERATRGSPRRHEGLRCKNHVITSARATIEERQGCERESMAETLGSVELLKHSALVMRVHDHEVGLRAIDQRLSAGRQRDARDARPQHRPPWQFGEHRQQ